MVFYHSLASMEDFLTDHYVRQSKVKRYDQSMMSL